MNVNPFSYLIEKLKSKVSKSGDTMSGNLSVQVSGNAYLKVTNTDKSVDATLNSSSNGQHGLYSNGYNDGTFHDSGKWLINRQADGSTMINGNVEVPSQTGTLALKSNIFGNILAQTEQTNITSISVDISSITGDVHPRLWILELGLWNLDAAHIAFGYYRKSDNPNEMTSAQFVDNISAISSVSITSSTLTVNLNNGWSYARLYVLDK